MNRRLIIIIALIVAVIAGAFAYLALQNSGEDTTQESAQTAPAKTEEAAPAADTAKQPASSTPGAYKDYSANVIASTNGTKILFFHAPWCPQCRQLEGSIKAGTIPDNVTIFKVDYDSSQALRQKYGVTIQTTLVKVDDSGNLVKRYVAYDEPTLDNLKANLLR